MWNLGQRDIIVLVSVISGCAILCNVWGPFVALTIALILIICACITVVVADDTLLTPHARLALDYLEETGRELNIFLENTYDIIREYIVYIVDALKDLYRTHIVARMSQRRRSTYQLSTESFPTSRNSSRFNLVDGLSPIARGSYRPNTNSSNLENSYTEANTMILNRADSFGKVTSTPLVPWRKDDSRNGDVFGANHLGTNKTTWTKSPSVSQNHTLLRSEDTTYSPEGSPWGTSISPKMRARASGVKTVQTVAGPLLASTRYNIDPKVYSDVTSPGLTTRLTKYATEANTKLTHQSQYGTGQFPRVNLNSSPTPLINTKNGKMRMPVTVRVAPPENTRYSPPERQKILSNICHAESKTPPSVVQVLREISLKRHASREDVTFELAKKQRTDAVFSDGLENLEEMTQKRARDDSSRSEEEISPQNKSLRPAKRSKMPSCYDILSSLSSSINVTSGIKRKAIDISRSGTPDLGKHFKSLDSSHGDVAAPTSVSRTISEPTKPNKRTLNEFDTSRNSDVHSPHKKLLESIPQKGILKSPPSTSKLVDNSKAGGDVGEKYRPIEERDSRIAKENSVSLPRVPVKLTDKLFMKAEPQNIDKLKTLIEEHGSIKPRFTTNDTDEIKKSDIVNMRQTSMKTRLKSMFDAISGKAPSKINPEVVIQAEEAKAPTSSSITASLSSSTSTTNINTSPIATSAIVPIITKTKPNTTPAKHVTFQLTTADTSNKVISADATKSPITQTALTGGASESGESKKPEIPASVEKTTATNLPFQSSNPPNATTSVAAFSFGSSSLNTGATATTTATPVAKTTSSASPATTVVAGVGTSPPQFNSTQISNSNLFANLTPAVVKSADSALPAFNASTQSAEKNSPTSANNLSLRKYVTSNPTANPSNRFGFGMTSNPTEGRQVSAAEKKSSSPLKSIFGSGAATTATPTAFSSNTTTSSFANTAAPATTSMFSFGGNTAPQNTEKKAFTFGGGAASGAENTTTVPSITTNQPVSTAISAIPATSGGFSFSTSNSAPSKNTNLFGTVTTASSTPSSVFPTATANTTAAFTFGSNTTAAAKPGFSFGTNATTAPVATSASAGSTISFGATNTSTASMFGAPSTTSSTTTANSLPSIFGTPATTVAATTASNPSSLFGVPATSASAFATPTTASTFGATSNQPTFAAPSSNAFGTQKTMETPTFGSNMGPPPAFAATTTGSSLFGDVNSNATAAAPTTAAPAFGTSSFGQTKPPPAFGANATPAFASGAAGGTLFGSQPPTSGAFGVATTAASVSTPMFGTPSTSAPAFGTPSTSASTFGTPSTSASAFGTPTTAPPPFGATNTSTTSFGAATTAIPSFGTINTSTSAFGAQSSAGSTSANQNFSTTSPAFGAVTTSAPPAFGAAITTPSAFGTSSTSGFGTSNNPPPAFSTGSTSFTGFGATNASSPFGSQPTPGTSSFGTPSSTTPAFGGGNNNTSSFTFGGSQPAAQPVQQQQQQSAVFAFGGNSAAPANNAPNASTPFQFGSSAPQTGGFNFTGGPSAPALNFSKDGAAGGAFAAPALGANSFSAPTTGGMFSIGSGSTGPRSRPSRRRQR